MVIVHLVAIGNDFYEWRRASGVGKQNVTTTWTIGWICEYTETLRYKSFAIASGQ